MSDLGNKEIMAKNIRHFLALNDLSQTDICNALGFKMATFSDWVNAKTYPRIDKIEMMANYFGISKSDLVEKRDSTPKTAEDLRALLHGTNTAVIMTKGENGQTIIELTPEEANLAKSLIETLRKQKENEKE